MHSPRRNENLLHFEEWIDSVRFSSSPEADCPRKGSDTSDAANVTITADFEYGIAPDDCHNAGPQLLGTSMSNALNESSREPQGRIHRTEKTRQRLPVRSLSPKCAPSGSWSTSIERRARSSSEHDHVSKLKDTVPQNASDRAESAPKMKRASSRSRSRQHSFESHTHESTRNVRPEAAENLHCRSRSPHQKLPHNSHMKSMSPHSRPEPSMPSDLPQLVERQHQQNLTPRSTDAGRISTSAGYISRSIPALGSTAKEERAHVSVGKLDKRRSERKSKDKKDNRGKDKKKSGLTTRSWRAKLAEHFGRDLQECRPMDKSRSYRANATIPSSILCSNDFAGEIQDDLTVTL